LVRAEAAVPQLSILHSTVVSMEQILGSIVLQLSSQSVVVLDLVTHMELTLQILQMEALAVAVVAEPNTAVVAQVAQQHKPFQQMQPPSMEVLVEPRLQEVVMSQVAVVVEPAAPAAQ
jgi:hypothetical protein